MNSTKIQLKENKFNFSDEPFSTPEMSSKVYISASFIVFCCALRTTYLFFYAFQYFNMTEPIRAST